jgi:ligand-binding sensor domain-containing protein
MWTSGYTRCRPGVIGAAALILALLTAAPSSAQYKVVPHPGELTWSVSGSWRQRQGLPQDRVIGLYQARDGRIWVGTRAGAARFDGATFESWNDPEQRTIPDGEVYAFAETADGSVWIAVNGGGLVRYLDGAFSSLTTADGLVDNLGRSLAVDRDGALWVGTDRGLSRYANRAFTNYTVKDGLADPAVRCLAVDPGGHGVLVGTRLGLQRLESGRFTSVRVLPGGRPVSVNAVIFDRSGRLWVGTSNGLVLAGAEGPVVAGAEHGLSSQYVRSVLEDADGYLWVATTRGVDRSTTPVGPALRFAGVLADVDASVVRQDAEGGVWVGFLGFGLVRLQRSFFRVWDSAAGLPSSTSSSVFESSDGTIWAGSGTAVGAIRDRRAETFDIRSGLPDRAVSSFAEDRSGRLLVGTESGLYRSVDAVRRRIAGRPFRFQAVGKSPALRTHIRAMCVDDDGSVVAGTTANGVVRLAGRDAESVPPGGASGEVRALLCGGGDGLWIGTRGTGLLHAQGSGVTTYTTRNGLSDDNVQSLHRDPDGVLWVSTRRGLNRLSRGRLTALLPGHGLPEGFFYDIGEDAYGRFWLPSGRGVFVIRRQDLNAVADGALASPPFELLGLEHGLPSTLCALSHHPIVTIARNGRAWVATLGGAVEADPVSLHTAVAPPPVRIETVEVNGRARQASAPVEAMAGRGTLVFAFTAPSFVSPLEIRFRYRLDGSDPGWVEGGTSRSARYTNIAPGRYRFWVTARSPGSGWNESPAFVDVVLTPHYYQTAWFIALVAVICAGLVAGLGYGVHRGRVARFEARERDLKLHVERAVADIKILQGLLPICAWCKKIRDDKGYWTQMEAYIKDHSEAVFSHGMCPDCLAKHRPEGTVAPDKGL